MGTIGVAEAMDTTGVTMVNVTDTVIPGAAERPTPKRTQKSSGHVREEIVCHLERFLGV